MKKKDDINENIDKFLNDDIELSKDEIKSILKDYKKLSKRMERIIKQSDAQQLAMMKLNDELNSYKKYLEEKVQEEIKKRQEKEKILFQQSKLAAMGEMIDAVAHQWKQPLNVISANVVGLVVQSQLDMLDEDYIFEFEKNITTQINHMTETLNEFRNFFRPSTKNVSFDARSMIDSVLLLIKDEFMKNNIEIIVNEEQSFTLIGIENEFKHLVINILNNAKDAFIENEIEDRKIIINLIEDDEYKKIEFIDNAGGIPEDIIDNIFTINFTTKEEGKGTGIGLYMSSQIAQKYHGDLSVENLENGAKFTFSYKKNVID